MLRACRAARWVPIVLFAAALLTVAGSFGLHPEPVSEPGAPEWSAGASESAGAHGCLACLAHRSISVVGASVFAPAAAVAVAAAAPAPVRALSLFAAPGIDGRAPPALG